MKTLYINLVCAFLMSGAVQLQAQNAFVNYTQADGLPDNYVTGVAVDASNHAWFATSAGVAEFDGASWTVYTTADGLVDDYINCIAVAPNGDVWAGTDAGVSKYNGASWTSFTTLDGLVDNMVKYIAVEPSGVVWIATSGGASRFDGASFTSLTNSLGMPSTLVSYVAIDANNNKWFGTWLGGLAKYDDTVVTVYDTNDGLPDNNITSVVIDSNGFKYVGTYYGIAILNAQDVWVRTITHADGLYNDYIRDMAIDSKGRMYAGMFIDYLIEGGITAFSGMSFWSYSVPEGLVSPYVNRMVADQNDDIWIATGNGVSKFLGAQLKVAEPVKDATLTIFPNPASNLLTVATTGQGAARCSISALNGQLISTRHGPEGQFEIDITILPAGVYLVKVEQNGKVYHSKFSRH